MTTTKHNPTFRFAKKTTTDTNENCHNSRTQWLLYAKTQMQQETKNWPRLPNCTHVEIILSPSRFATALRPASRTEEPRCKTVILHKYPYPLKTSSRKEPPFGAIDYEIFTRRLVGSTSTQRAYLSTSIKNGTELR
ncbi:unnamed protein product [Ectocarpus sp. 12 AP-2014]